MNQHKISISGCRCNTLQENICRFINHRQQKPVLNVIGGKNAAINAS
jgi:hypothetical protein